MMCLGICSLRFALIIESRFTFLAAPHPAPQIWNIFCHYLFEYIFSSIILSIFCLLSFKGFRTIVFVIVSEELFFFLSMFLLFRLDNLYCSVCSLLFPLNLYLAFKPNILSCLFAFNFSFFSF